MKPHDEVKLARLFPNSAARAAADRHIDTLSVREPFYNVLDEWVRAYLAAGGTTPYAGPT